MQGGGSAGEVKVRKIIILMCNVIKQCRKGSFEFLKKAMKN